MGPEAEFNLSLAGLARRSAKAAYASSRFQAEEAAAI
jgi:hypothetical protein